MSLEETSPSANTISKHSPAFLSRIPKFKAYRDLKYKYIWTFDKDGKAGAGLALQDELYDITKDPLEQHNLLPSAVHETPRYPEMLKKALELKEKLENFLLSLDAPPIQISSEVARKLKAYGFLKDVIIR